MSSDGVAAAFHVPGYAVWVTKDPRRGGPAPQQPEQTDLHH